MENKGFSGHSPRVHAEFPLSGMRFSRRTAEEIETRVRPLSRGRNQADILQPMREIVRFDFSGTIAGKQPDDAGLPVAVKLYRWEGVGMTKSVQV